MYAVNDLVDRQTLKALDLQPEESAKLVGLKYVKADDLKIIRKKVGRGFSYLLVDGSRLTDQTRSPCRNNWKQGAV